MILYKELNKLFLVSLYFHVRKHILMILIKSFFEVGDGCVEIRH